MSFFPGKQHKGEKRPELRSSHPSILIINIIKSNLILHEDYRNGTEHTEIMDRIPWVEYNIKKKDFASLPLPRVFATHLPYYLTPRDLRNKKGRVILHRHRCSVNLPFLTVFLKIPVKFGGELLASAWFDHISGWYNHANDFNILFLTYEEMKKDLRSAVLKICNFIGKKLSEKEIESVVRQATFENMQKDPRANYENMPEDIAMKGKGRFLRKGTVGDWKNTMTVAQSERFDEVLKEKIQTLPIKFTWDIDSEIASTPPTQPLCTADGSSAGLHINQRSSAAAGTVSCELQILGTRVP
uniref:Sulfotransferase n=1 Tax=Pavo cristatus TaxID=9049 RepID=A0A8C9F0Q5_PAVCR